MEYTCYVWYATDTPLFCPFAVFTLPPRSFCPYPGINVSMPLTGLIYLPPVRRFGCCDVIIEQANFFNTSADITVSRYNQDSSRSAHNPNKSMHVNDLYNVPRSNN